MPVFKYKAKNNLGKITDGTIEADSQAAVAGLLRQKRLEMISVSSGGGLAGIWKALNIKGGKVTKKGIGVFSRQFLTINNDGLPSLQGLTNVANQAENSSFSVLIT